MIRGIVIDMGGFAPLDEQREAVGEAGEVVVLAPASDGAWVDAVTALIDAAAPGDAIAVAALHVLGPSARGILTALDRARALGVDVISAADEIDTREDAAPLTTAGLFLGAADRAAEARARRSIALAASRPEGISPPRALYVPERYLGAVGEHGTDAGAGAATP
ncbi:recombinase family protein [Agromyces archimandritae]|uniref:Recombinase family protein n=1 Tax=Agromyces archimandritae TaxID=2781962 RepID=A0A975FPY5_9MICO|nr:recombinase family protein [Agromyces archimandritae]QTX05877.1 recombinase family protein [Agromyces archimandritae]